ncbi:hypothetical protein NDU88_005798 [Pleurodeles waltl]|uniref:Uncharacterized protein n=1 Tax=Pleurodeles waltl TaxID=8319 RepID=A0AAV7WBK0_PLEWA|nr:hypothetical protein NDU88_005798 [Pleurodeles waltl]
MVAVRVRERRRRGTDLREPWTGLAERWSVSAREAVDKVGGGAGKGGEWDRVGTQGRQEQLGRAFGRLGPQRPLEDV